MLFSRKTFKEHLGFDDLWLIILGVPLMGFLTPILFYNVMVDDAFGFKAAVQNTLEGSFFVVGYWAPNRWAIIKIRRYYPDFEDVKKRLVFQMLISLLIVAIMTPILMTTINLIADSLAISIHKHPTLIQTVGSTLFVTFFILSIYESIFFYHQLKYSIMEKEAVKQAHLRSQWEGLRNQVNPHFLFNSLNTLMNIVAEDQKLAQRFLKKLSTVYRYILESREDPLIVLKEELVFVHSYVFLLQERFRGKLQIHINIPEKYQHHKIVPLSLQILLENAIKHNIIAEKKPLAIEVFVDERQKLVVRNSLQRKQYVLDSTKVGLANIRIRYQFFSEESVDIDETVDFFSVAIPLIP